MSVLIRGMEMPENGSCIQIVIDDDGKVYPSVEKCILKMGSIAKAVSVPPHGDLVDRKVAFDYWLCAANDFCWSPTDENFKKALEATPTVIPADEVV